MNNKQSNTDTKKSFNSWDSLGYFKMKRGSVTLTINTIQGVNGCGPNLYYKGNTPNSEYANKNTKNKLSIFRETDNNTTPT